MAELNDYISVDCVIFGVDAENLNVLIVERTLTNKNDEIIFSDFTLTGNHILNDETLEDAAARVLYDLTGLNNIYLEQFHAFSHPTRLKAAHDQLWLKELGMDPNQRIITVGYLALLSKSDVTLEWKGRNVQWVPINQIKKLGFDHMTILATAHEALKMKIKQEPIGFELLPEKFTLSQLQRVYEILLDKQLDKRNFRKKLSKVDYLIPLDEKQRNVAHKPAQLYTFNRKAYDKFNKGQFDFSV